MSGGIVKEGAAQNSGAINRRRQQNLAETIAEIKELLKQLSQEYPTSTNVLACWVSSPQPNLQSLLRKS